MHNNSVNEYSSMMQNESNRTHTRVGVELGLSLGSPVGAEDG